VSWDYAHALNSLDLSDVATFAVIEDEAPSPYSDAGVQIPGRDGVRFDPEAPFSPLVVSLKVHLRWTDENGEITHTDGEGGHIRENLSLIKRELNKPAPMLTRTIEHIGAVRAVVKSNTPGFVGAQRHVYHFPLTVGSGSWQTATESSNTGAPATGVITTGDREIFDPRVSLASTGTRTVTTAEGRVYSIVAVSGPTYPVVIDVGAGTALDNGGNDALGAISFSHDHWFRLSANHTHTITGGSATWFWRNRWA
jgi:hypothetical protein